MSNMNLYNSLLAGKLADGSDFSPTTAQLTAMNSGIDSTKVVQIETNKTNISLLEVLNGKKNKIKYTLDGLKALNSTGTWSNNVYTDDNLSITVNDDLSLSINGSLTNALTFKITDSFDYYGAQSVFVGLAEQTVSTAYLVIGYSENGTTGNNKNDTQTNARVSLRYNYGKILLWLASDITHNMDVKPMIVDKVVSDANMMQYMPYAPSNRELYKMILELQS